MLATNFFGFDTPAIVAAESIYEEMWAADVAAMIGYHGAGNAVPVVGLAEWHTQPEGLPVLP